jgi:hypothetical protein
LLWSNFKGRSRRAIAIAVDHVGETASHVQALLEQIGNRRLARSRKPGEPQAPGPLARAQTRELGDRVAHGNELCSELRAILVARRCRASWSQSIQPSNVISRSAVVSFA